MLNMKHLRLSIAAVVLIVLPTLWALAVAHWSFANLWLTPDQQAQRLFNQDQYAEAAKRFSDPMRQGMANYRAGNFKKAAAAFARRDTSQSVFNRGNALVMSGKYDDAIKSYERALQSLPDWTAAQVNRSIAVARQDRMAPPEDDAGKGDKLSDEELRTLWLRRVQTKPADFLRVKFGYQLSRQRKGEATQ